MDIGRGTGRARLTGAALLIATLLAAACSSDAGGPTPPTDNVVARVEISAATTTLLVGASQRLTARVYNAAGTELSGHTVSWISEAPGVASVGADGTVNAMAAGSARINASSGGQQASVTLTIVNPGGGGSTGTITVNPAIRHQTMSGWEAHAESGHITPGFGVYRNQLFDQAANDLGINRLRLEVRSGSENNVDYYMQWRRGQIDDATWRCVRFATVNDNSDPRSANLSGFHFSQMDSLVEAVVLPMRQRLAARGERLIINLTYTAFTNTICNPGLYHHDDSPEEYAELIVTASQHLRTKYGITPDYWEVILEPDNTPFWRGNTIGAAILATAPRLQAAGFTPRFVTPSTARPNNAVSYFDLMLQQHPGVRPFLAELSYHRYGTVTDAQLQTIASRAEQNGINTAMLEHIGSDYNDLHKDLKLANVSAWQQFALAFPTTDNGAQYYVVNDNNPSSPQLNLGTRTRFLRQYFRFVRENAVRVEATSAAGALDPVAFINPDGGFVVVVRATAGASFTVGGLPAARYGIKYTTTNAYDVDLPDVTITATTALSTSIPVAGVLTIYRK